MEQMSSSMPEGSLSFPLKECFCSWVGDNRYVSSLSAIRADLIKKRALRGGFDC